MKNKNQTLIALLALHLFACQADKNNDIQLSNTETIAVTTYTIAQNQGNIQINSTGMMSTEHDARYAFKIGGVVDRIYVNEGEFFKKGKLLATLKTEEIEAGTQQARLGLEKAARDLQRIANLYRDSVATLEQYQNTKTAFDLAQKQLDALLFNQSFAQIYAANDGFVTRKLANTGEIVAGGMPILAINETADDGWLLKVGLADKDWALTAIGDTTLVTLDAFPNQAFSGFVYRKSQAAETGTGSFQVEIKVDCRDIQPAIGMFGKATIKTKVVQQYQSIPYEALIEADGNTAYVFVPTGQGSVRKQAIQIVGFDNHEVQVKSGLEGVTSVVISNSAFLNERSKISIIQ